MKIEKAIEIIKTHNKWRRGAEIPMTNAIELGVAIDVIVKYFEKHVAQHINKLDKKKK